MRAAARSTGRWAGRSAGHLQRTIVRLLRRWRRWLADRPGWMVVALGVLSFIVLSASAILGSFAWEVVAACTIHDSPADCAATMSGGPLLTMAGVAFVYALAIYVLSQIVGAVIWSRMSELGGRDAKCRALIMGLSPASISEVDEICARFKARPQDYTLPIQEYRALTISPDGNKLTPKKCIDLAIFWQQNARAIQHHLPGLKRVLVLPSTESDRQWKHFEKLTTAFYPGIKVERVTDEGGRIFANPHDGAQSYEDYAYVRDGLDRAVIQLLERDEKLVEADICVDVTPGQKLFSIAAAIATLNRDIKLSYVSTLDGRVRVFDAEIGTADSLAQRMT